MWSQQVHPLSLNYAIFITDKCNIIPYVIVFLHPFSSILEYLASVSPATGIHTPWPCFILHHQQGAGIH